MGKHERQFIEEAEKIIVKLLSSQKLSGSDKKNNWFKHAVFLTKRIKRDFPKITLARHLGNRYNNTGDILVISKYKEFFIEIKMSDTKLGIGTKANISQDALTENCLFMGKIKSWSRFRQGKNHDKWINDYLNQFKKYPWGISKITNPTTRREEKARYLRKLAEKKNKKAKNILDDIQKKDKKEKIEYLTYLRGKKQKNEMVKRFFVLITLGVHRKEELENLIKKDNFFQEIQNLFVYYGNSYFRAKRGIKVLAKRGSYKSKIIIRKEDVGERIKKILERYPDFKIIFPKGLTHCKIVGVSNKDSKQLLQIVFHWKNIAQGIKTPCLNIFDLTAKST